VAEPVKIEPSRGRIDLLTLGAAVFFLLAIGLSALPIFHFRADLLSGLLLFLGLAGVAVVGFMAFRQSLPVAEVGLLDAEAFIGALVEPAAVAAEDGSLIVANPAWVREIGPDRRLPKGAAIFRALKEASKFGGSEAQLQTHGFGAGQARIRALPDGQFLVRLLEASATVELAPSVSVVPGKVVDAVTTPATLNLFASAAPFAAALLEGADPLNARIVEYNQALPALAGPIAADATLGSLIDAGSYTEVQDRLGQGRSGPIEVLMAHDANRIAHLYLTGDQERPTAFLVDITEAKQLERQLAQAGKMQAVGQLAAGIAHDFNNLITGINFQLDELHQRHPLGDPSYEGLTAVRQTAARAADLVRKLKTYSRQETVRRETLDLGEVIHEFEVLLRRVLREDVPVDCEYGRDLPLVRADKGQLEMAVMNLAVNAKDAIRTGGGTTVKIRTARLSPDEARGMGYGGPLSGDMALIEVSDDGPGIPKEIIGKIFEPFFTTKPVNEGTGFGLAMVFGIVKQSDGWIHVDSEPGQGAAFRIFLPVYEPAAVPEGQDKAAVASPAEVKAAKPKAAPRDLSGVGRILFVEDENDVRGIAARLLRMRGYEVLEAADGEEALILAREHAGQIDLMISDVVMPGMDGPTLLKNAREYLAGAPVLFISGYAEAEFSDLLEGETGISFLPKPIDIKALAERVKQELQAAA
jgi:two-component system cell cycle sensor histidine kinase/response regulator CckA